MKLLFYSGILAVFLFSACNTAPTSIPTPTKVVSTKTPLPSSTPTSRPVTLRACVTDSTIRVRQGPGTDSEVIGGLVSGTCMSILERNQDASWVYMISEDDKTGWVAASLLTIEGNLNKVSVRTGSETLSLAPTLETIPTSTRRPVIVPTSTPQSLLSRFVPLCSEAQSGTRVTCQIPRASCDYRPDVDGDPTFCNDRPYPDQEFTLVVFGEDWSDLDGSCIIVTGYAELYRGELQIQAVSRSQVSYCE